MRHTESRSQMLAARLTSAAIIIMGLYVAKQVLIPLGLALLLAFMLQPSVRRLRRLGLPNLLAVVVTSVVFFALIALLMYVIAGQAREVVLRIPDYKKELVERVSEIRGSLRGGSIEKIKSTVTEVMEEVVEKERAESNATESAESPPVETSAPVPKAETEEPLPTKVIVANEGSAVDDLSSAASLLTPLGTAGLVVLLVVLLLLKWSDLRARLVALVDDNLSNTTAALDDAGQRVSRYLAMQFMVNLGAGLVVWGGLSLIGLEWAGLIGLCAALFRYIPYVGPMAAAALPIALSLATTDGWGSVIAVGLLFVILELVLNNVIEPWLYGSRLGVSEIGIIIAAVAWTLLWGPAGLVLATPLTVCLVVIGEKVPGLAFISKMLSDRPHLPEHFALTQRLIAGDTIEASDILARYRDRATPESAFDDMVVPALARVRHEQRLGQLESAAATAAAAALPPLFAELAPDAVAVKSPLAKDSVLAVWSLCPMSETAASMLPERLRQIPCSFLLFNAQSLASDVIGRLREAPPLGIALLHLHPTDFPRVTATLRRLRRALPDLPVIVARWGDQTLTASERDDLAGLGATAVVITPSELASWVGPRALSVARVLREHDGAS
ncbi:MAG: AI-2E family transporter [Verrucomicrobiales bacterium]